MTALKDITDINLKVAKLYDVLNAKRNGKVWQAGDIMRGFVGDVGDLTKLTMVMDDLREIPDAQQKLAHELADCLWSVIVLADMYDIDLWQTSMIEMTKLAAKVESKIKELD
jgi:NTP pyrophosphatase (non-canonical NTP hydrolase)